MDTLHYRHYHGFIWLLVLFHFSIFGLALKIRSSIINGDQKRFLTNSPQHGKEFVMCTHLEPDVDPITYMSCNEPGSVMTKINFADYGNPTGTCGHFGHGNCGAPATMRIVKKNCLGKEKCYLLASDEMFGPSHCKEVPTLAVETICTKT